MNEPALSTAADAKETVHKPRDALPEMGGLVDEAPDTMTLHTKEAYRLFIGRRFDATNQVEAIAGGRRVAASLRAIWYLSSNDNPYADWVLVNMGERIGEIGSSLESETERRLAIFDGLKRRGLSFSVLQARLPLSVELGFKSPYGYAVADLIVRYDFFTRVIKTLVRKDLLADRDGAALIFSYTRRLRRLFEEPARFERWLLREELRPLSRHDFLPASDSEANRRVEAVVALLGPVPREIFTGAKAPRHSKRRLELSAQELKLLQEAHLGTPAVASEAEEAALL